MEKLGQFVQALQPRISLKVRFKDQSRFMKLLGFLTKAFNPEFMTSFTTTIGSTVYFPSEAYVEEDELRALRILAHEAIHAADSAAHPVLFPLSFLFPQILFLGVLSFPWLGWWALLFLLALAPWPAPFRVWWEAKAYAMNVVLSRDPEAAENWALTQFTGSTYYFMDPTGWLAQRWLTMWASRIADSASWTHRAVLRALPKDEG